MITKEQCRAGRGLVDWSQGRLAEAASVGLSTVRQFEGGTRNPIANNLAAIRYALEQAGVQFLADGDVAAGNGVVLKVRAMSSDARAKLAVAG